MLSSQFLQNHHHYQLNSVKILPWHSNNQHGLISLKKKCRSKKYTKLVSMKPGFAIVKAVNSGHNEENLNKDETTSRYVSGNKNSSTNVVESPPPSGNENLPEESRIPVHIDENFSTNESKTLTSLDTPTPESMNLNISKDDSAKIDGDVLIRRTSRLSVTADKSIVIPDKYTHKVNIKAKYDLSQIGIFHDAKLEVELVAAKLEENFGYKKSTIVETIEGRKFGDVMVYEQNFLVPLNFGEIGAVRITNTHTQEIYVYSINITNIRGPIANIICNSWIHSKNDNPTKRIFFTYKPCLPCETPSGLKSEREEELNVLRGRGDGERKKFERIYDYDVYNDLGTDKLPRPTLGGSEFAYPRRCRTGRPLVDDIDGNRTEPMGDFLYVPRDEAFGEVKSKSFGVNKVMAFVRALFPSLVESMALTDKEFTYFTQIDTLFKEGMEVRVKTSLDLLNLLPTIIKSITDTADCVLRFDVPELMERDRFSWLRDEEFCRQTLAGVNPLSIQLVKTWPLVSTLPEKDYGPPVSAITKEMVEQQLNGQMALEEAIEQKKLFIIDYHDTFLPYVKKVRRISGTTMYGTRTLMFLKPTDELIPIAIELTRPKDKKQPQWRQVFMPGTDKTTSWLWKLAKVHALSLDSGYHQLVSHWLRTHCAAEPYVIATNRQLSAMHPIYRLLHPHLRYTMEINAEARKSLINADGIIEIGFAPGKYSMELSSIAYNSWRFDLEALPADLISRGMAEEDKDAPHGLKLAIQDYPYANDGLILWDAIEEWVSSYVNRYYPDEKSVTEDYELQKWWDEIRNVGHGDKKDEKWWPVLNTQKDLIKILTTMIWVVSGHHAAVNFGQYPYAGYFPNRPSIARTNMPTEDCSDVEWKRFIEKPEQTLLACLPSVFQATIVMGIISVLSDHAVDEEYIGQYKDPAWVEDSEIDSAFDTFSARLSMLKATINKRNGDKSLKNRVGSGIVPYTLLKPDSEPGVTGQGVPNSISI